MQSDAELAKVLLDDFNDYRARTQRHFELRDRAPYMTKPLTPTAERMKLFAEMITWCRERNLEPRAWLYGLFRVRNWVYPVKATKGCLMSEKLIAKIKRLPAGSVLRHRVQLTQKATTFGGDIDPNKDIIASVETMKQNYAQRGLYASCFVQMETMLGYHPKSAVCATCPLQQQCAVTLTALFPFDIIGLRQGTVTVQQAEEAARAAAH